MDIDLAFKVLEDMGIDPWMPGDWDHFKTIQEQTGYKRTHPRQLCQDHKALAKVTFFNYCLQIPQFCEYASERGISPAEFNFLEEAQIIQAAKLQDVWELWLKEIGALAEDPDSGSPPSDDQKILRLKRTIFKPVSC